MLIITPDIQTNTPQQKPTKPTKWLLLSILTIAITIVAIFQMEDERLTYCKLLQGVRKIFLDHCETLDFKTVFSSGRIISQSLTKKDCGKIDYLFQDKNKALIWARENLGHNTKAI